ncbi:MAG: phytanoyl-CoA dioxygenase family protein [Nitrospirota bacterium]
MDLVDQQLLQFETQGFVHLPGVIPADLVTRVKKTFDSAAELHRAEWEMLPDEHRARAPYYDIPDILDVDDAFVDLADLPSIWPLLLKAIGTDIQLNHTHARIMFPGKTFTASFHSDLVQLQGINLATSPHFFAKVHFYFEDLDPEQGCLGFIPGSHFLPATNNPKPPVDEPENSSVTVRIVPKAGDAVLFNTHCRHMAFDNRTNRPRKSLIYAYSHFWLKNYANAQPSDLERLATTKERRQLFGVDTPDVSYLDQRLDLENLELNYNTMFARTKRLLKRALKGSSITK